MNYESEIEYKIIKELTYKYGFISEKMTYQYIILKFELLKILKTKNKDLMNFIFTELNITEYMYLHSEILTYGIENNFNNILDNWKYRCGSNDIFDENGVSYSFEKYISKNTLNIIKYANKKSSFIKINPNYDKINAYFRLKKLNELFAVSKINEPRKIVGFKQGYMLNIEEELNRYYHSVNFETNLLKTISEEDFEKYITMHLEDIEDGLTLISRQYEVKDGIIDILAKDKNNNLVIIELKITIDKHLIWQVMYYPVALINNIPNSKVRIITICPEYPSYIKIPLKTIGNVELIKYNAIISNKKIINVEFKKEVA